MRRHYRYEYRLDDGYTLTYEYMGIIRVPIVEYIVTLSSGYEDMGSQDQ